MSQGPPAALPQPPAAPLSWQCGYADGPGGRVCTVQIRQAAQAYMLTLQPDDMPSRPAPAW